MIIFDMESKQEHNIIQERKNLKIYNMLMDVEHMSTKIICILSFYMYRDVLQLALRFLHFTPSVAK